METLHEQLCRGWPLPTHTAHGHTHTQTPSMHLSHMTHSDLLISLRLKRGIPLLIRAGPQSSVIYGSCMMGQEYIKLYVTSSTVSVSSRLQALTVLVKWNKGREPMSFTCINQNIWKGDSLPAHPGCCCCSWCSNCLGKHCIHYELLRQWTLVREALGVLKQSQSYFSSQKQPSECLNKEDEWTCL